MPPPRKQNIASPSSRSAAILLFERIACSMRDRTVPCGSTACTAWLRKSFTKHLCARFGSYCREMQHSLHGTAHKKGANTNAFQWHILKGRTGTFHLLCTSVTMHQRRSHILLVHLVFCLSTALIPSLCHNTTIEKNLSETATSKFQFTQVLDFSVQAP